MSEKFMRLLELITPWRDRDREKERDEATYTEVRKSVARRRRLEHLNQSYRIADVIFERRNGDA